MADAKEWASFFSKLGMKVPKKYVIDYIIEHRMNNDEIWNYFIESHSLIKETVNANHIYNADDVDAYFREISYIQMRGTFPRRSHGHSLIIQRLITIQEIKAQKKHKLQTNNLNEKSNDVHIPNEILGKHITHTVFGSGKIINIINNRYIIVAFENIGDKTLNFQMCISNGFINID